MPATLKRLREEAVNTSKSGAHELVDPNRPLTEKMRNFVRFWAMGESILSASYKAGYADGGTYAYRLAKDPAILKMYEAEKRAYEEASQMTRKRVIDGLLEAIDMAKLVSEPGSMIAGWREIGKMCGYYAPVEQKLTIDHTSSVLADRLNKLSDAELLKLIQEEPDVVDVEARETTDAAPELLDYDDSGA